MADSDEMVVLVDSRDRKVGLMEKIQAQKEKRLHRAFSIFVFNSKGQTLLQQRALSKYHGGGLWSNTCCSHPRDEEYVAAAAHRKLKQELNFDCPLTEIFSFIYQADMKNGLWEHEYDHVLVGHYDGPVKPNPDEAMRVKWEGPDALLADFQKNPDKYSVWMRESLERTVAYYRKHAKPQAK